MVSLGDNGLVVGVGTILARMTKGGGLALDADRERLLALLSVAARRPMSADILGSLEAAAGHWRRGDRALANFRLIFAGLPQLDDPTYAWRVRLAEALLDDGMSPRALMVELDLDPEVLTRAHYNPDEPRVGVGNGTESGRWADGEGTGGSVPSRKPADVSELSPNIVHTAADGPVKPDGTVIVPTPEVDPLDPKQLNQIPSVQEQQAIAATLTPFDREPRTKLPT